MNLFQELWSPLNPEYCWLLTMCLLHTLWQGTLIALVAAAVVRLKQTSVHNRFAMTFGLLLLICVMPICNYVWLSNSSPQSVELATQRFLAEDGLKLYELGDLKQAKNESKGQAGEYAMDIPWPTTASPSFAGTNDVERRSNFEADLSTAHQSIDVHSKSVLPKSEFGWAVLGPVVFTILYLFGVFVMVVRLGFGLKSHWRLTNVCNRLKFSDRVPSAVMAAAEKAASSLGRTLQTPIALFHGEGVALVVGCARPVILLNACLVSGLTPVQLEQILAHELAHVYRFDPLTQLLQRLIESVLFFHPGVWYVSRQVSDLRELCCDEWATQNHSRVDFAETLLQCAMFNRGTKASTRYSLAATGSRASQLTSRIDALLQSNNVIGWKTQKKSRGRIHSNTSNAILFVAIISLFVAAVGSSSSRASFSAMLFENQQDKDKDDPGTPVILKDVPSWQWKTEEPNSISPSQFLFGGKQLTIDKSIPEDVDLQAMVVEEKCKFAQWHFGDSNSTRVAIVLEMDGKEISRLFIDRNRDRVIDDGEAVTTKSKNEKTWVTSLEVEVHESGDVVRTQRQIGITPNRDKSKVRITTLGYAEGEIVLGEETLSARRVDKDGNGLPTDKLDEIWIDFDQNGQFDKLTERLKLNSVLDINGERFMVRSDRLGQSLVLTPGNECGFVKFEFELADSTAKLETFEGSLRDESGLLIVVGLNEKPTAVPVGRYCLQDLVVQVRDKDSAVWRMTLSRGLDSDWSNVKPEEMIEVGQDKTLKIPLLEDLNFSFVPQHAVNSYTKQITRLRPYLSTENGLRMTDFTLEKPNQKRDRFNNSVVVKFKVRDAAGTITDPRQCASSFG